MSTATLPAVEVGTPVQIETPFGSSGKGVVVAVEPQAVILGHDGTGVVWGESTTHVNVTVEWTDGCEERGTEPGTTSIVSVGHSFGGPAWSAGWTIG